MLMMDRQAFLQIRNENSTIKFIVPLCNKCSQTRAEQLYGEACCYFLLLLLLLWTKQFRLILSPSPVEYHIPQMARLHDHILSMIMICFGPYYILIHWSTLGNWGCWFVSVNSKTNLNFFLPHCFYQDVHFIHHPAE